MKKILWMLLCTPIIYPALAQEKTTPNNTTNEYRIIEPHGDTIIYKDKEAMMLHQLKKSAVVVRLKTNEKSIAAYNDAGHTRIGEELKNKQQNENELLMQAFKKHFTFGKVYFIYSTDTRKLLDKKKGILLNTNFKYDTKLALTDTHYVFVDYGAAEAYSNFTDQSGLAVPRPSSGGGHEATQTHAITDSISRTTTSSTLSDVLYFSDRNLQRLHSFPISDAVHDNNFDEAVITLNRRLQEAYNNAVQNRQVQIKNKTSVQKR